MNIFDLNQSDRTILSSLIRQSISDRINYNPHDYLWRNMRHCAGIPDQRHIITEHQAWLLMCIAMYWYERRSLPSPIERNRFANEAIARWNPTEMFTAIEERHIDWRELLQIIRSESGRAISERTIRDWGDRYRNCPHFSKKRTYTQSQVKIFLYYAHRSSAPKAA